MCKTFVVINKNPANRDILSDVMLANIDKLSTEKDGYSIYRDGKTEFFQGDEDYALMPENLEYRGEEMLMVHFRSATAGARDKTGLHLQKINKRFVYAHNGVVSNFNAVKNFSDSYYYFRNLIVKADYKVTTDAISQSLKDNTFWGRAFLYDEKLKTLHAWNTLTTYVYALEGCLILSSFDLETDVEDIEYKEVLGYTFKVEKEKRKITFLHESTFVDQHWTFKNGSLVSRAAIAKKVWSSGYNPAKEDEEEFGPYGGANESKKKRLRKGSYHGFRNGSYYVPGE
jgi:hypothetical protein